MSNKKSPKKKIITTKPIEQSTSSKIAPTTSRKSKMATSAGESNLLFAKKNYIFMAAGALIMIIGMFLMSGGQQPLDEWNVDEIYSFRRVTLAPIVILIGLTLVIASIFVKDKKAA